MAIGQVSFKDHKKVIFAFSLNPSGITLALASTAQSAEEQSIQSCPDFETYPLPTQIKRVHVPARLNPTVNRLNKTKVEKHPNLHQEREDRLKELRNRDRAAQQARQKEELRLARERKEKAWQRDHAYDDMFTEEAMAASSNQDRGADWEDDFM